MYGRVGSCLEVKIMLPLRCLAYGDAPHCFCSTFQVSLAQAKEIYNRFLGKVYRVYKEEYLQLPTAADLKSTLSCALLREDSVGIASRRLHDHAVRDADSVEALWDARMRSRDLLRIMNCVQCNKCRLHGKIAFLGLATAMQILVGHSGEGSDPGTLHRVELAALMTTLHRCSKAIQFCQEMQ